jgi:hypothetical protein
LKNIEPDWSKGTIPLKIDVPRELAKGKYHSYFTFVGEEAIELLRNFFRARKKLTPECLLFIKAGTDEAISSVAMSALFWRQVRRLKASGQLDFKERAGKPSELRLYCLSQILQKECISSGF